MFNSSSNRSRSPSAPGGSTSRKGGLSIIGADMVVTGNLTATADLHIDGRIEGDVACAMLIQGADSHIVGAVAADSARIAGAIEGAVRVRELIVERSARIVGDVEYESITIEQGGHVDGRMRHLGGVAVPATAAALAGPSGDEPGLRIVGEAG
ncbi:MULTISPECIES: bactofilin family protein [unclassified Sphingomonas]|uniref:bactofilin family protein n=2 Tax=Sphingomonas TaxID=13687 RepID=UPI0009E693D2|nr:MULTISPECIES: polymer-forming cytoskeletal protein [unclassified Sphingomonas]MCH4894135.1 polymer-forming cytoskeletal protein [Sphingomonas sp. SFZ2018-12]